MVMIVNSKDQHAENIAKFLVDIMVGGNNPRLERKDYSISQDTFKRTAEGNVTFISKGNVLSLNFKVQGEKFIKELSEQLLKGK